MKKRLILIDGNSLFNRAFYALPLLMNKKGMYTNAIFGFTNMMNHIVDNYNPDYMAVAFDLKAKTFRHLEYSDYKAGRKKMPEELRVQIEPIKDITGKLGIEKVEFEGYEADDIIGTLSLFGEENNLEVIIVTGDKDALQLASENTRVLITKKGISDVEVFDRNAVFERYGLTPTEFIDLKALMGDKSDNIKGVAGIGEKTGIKLIQDFKSIENIYENLDKIKGSVKDKLEKDMESAFLSKKLATIIRNMPIDFDLEELKYKGPDYDRLIETYNELEFSSLIATIPKGNEVSEELKREINLFDDYKEEIVAQNKDVFLAINYSKNTSGRLINIHKIYVKIDENIYVLSADNISLIKKLLENDTNRVIGNDLKLIYKSFYNYGIDIKNLYFDNSIAEYVVDSNSGKYNTEDLAAKYLNKTYENLEEILGKGKSKIDIEFADKEKINSYYTNVLDSIEKVYPILNNLIKENDLSFVFDEIEMKLIKVLASMEMEGFLINKKLLNELSQEYATLIRNLEDEIYNLAGEVFNINSPKQLGNILFEKLSLPHGKKTKTGYSTNIEVLEYIKEHHPIVNKIIDYRQITKLKSTYIEGLSAIVDNESGKVYTTFSQTTASTGRLSSIDPNLQNIPIRTERGRMLRALFIAPEGYKLVDADYSQIELRILAHLSKDNNMISAFENNIDIHIKTASEVFGVDIDAVTSEMRGTAKAVNFGIVYGISDFGLSNNLGISIADAKIYIEQYLSKYKDVQAYLDLTVKNASQNGFAKTEHGRIRYIPELLAKNAIVRSFGKRIAMNTPIQGTAADIIKIAMIKVNDYLNKNHPDAKMILQVHDELIIQAKESDSEEIKTNIIKIMEEAVNLTVKLEVDAKIGDSWFDTK